MCACGERLTEDLDCLTCGKAYTREEQGLKELDRAKAQRRKEEMA